MIGSLSKFKCPAGTEIKVISVVDFFEPFPVLEGVKEQEIQAARELVEQVAKELRDSHANALVTSEVLNGFPIDEILNCSTDWKADLIMLGSHGRKGISEFLMGSVSRGVLHNARCAVRIVRLSTQAQSTGLNVLICLDESKHSSHILDHLTNLPWPEMTRFKCVHVIPELDEKIYLDPDCEFATRMSQQYDAIYRLQKKVIDEAARKLNETFGSKVASAEILIGETRTELLKCAKEWPADLVMMGSHGRTGLEHLFLGSVSEAIATHAQCSVEVTRIPALKMRRPHIIV